MALASSLVCIAGVFNCHGAEIDHRYLVLGEMGGGEVNLSAVYQGDKYLNL